MSRRDDMVGLDVVGLDDLLSETEAPAAAGPVGGGTRWLLGRAFFALALGAVIFGLLYLVRIGVPYPLIALTIFVITLVRRALAEVAVVGLPATITGRGLRPPIDPEAAAAIDEGDRIQDGLRLAIGRWDSRLSYSGNDSERAARVLLPRLRDLADERLRLRHGITMAGDPERARHMMGERLWKMVHEPPGQTLTPRDMEAFVDRMEAL